MSDSVLGDASGFDEGVRWSPGERLHDVVARSVAAGGREQAVAAETDDGVLTFGDLLAWSDALALELQPSVAAGDRVALLFDRSPRAWVAMLALSKLAAAWVPLDASFPAERIEFIAADADVRLALTTADLAERLHGTGLPHHVIGRRPEHAVPAFRSRPTAEDVAYVIYTSGTTGRPKGVPIGHAGFCNFVRVAAQHYGFAAGDRVYQGLSIAFDFSVEEIWVPLVAGATLVTPPHGSALVGDELTAFLRDRAISAMCSVPTLLASVDADLPALRMLVVSGESCPQPLVRRWAVGGRRMINVYGPTEATVSATWTVLDPAEPVTIGVPLPTYRVAILDPETGAPSAPGAAGELVIGGVGVASGYLNRPEKTAAAFVTDPGFGLGARAYRTGDLVRRDEAGRIVYLGRIDTQVKLRGYRIELEEIESALMMLPGVSQAAVTVFRKEGRADRLAAFYTARAGSSTAPDQLLAGLRRSLPAFMVPATLDELPVLPMLTSQKVDRAALPAPRVPAPRGVRHRAVDPRVEAVVRAVQAVLEVDEVDPRADLFTDLGADSFSIARLCARLRDEYGAAVTTRLVYANPTCAALASALRVPVTAAAAPTTAPHHASRRSWALVGAGQAVVLIALLAAVAWSIDTADALLAATPGAAVYLTAVGITAALVILTAGVPIGLKWLLVGRWTERDVPAWSARYFRFWVVRFALRLSPVRLLAGSPLYTLFLRALGAKVGSHVLILSDHIPVCTDLISIGDDAVIAPGVKFDGYRVRAGRVEIGPVTIGADTAVGHGSHLDIRTRIGDGGRLAHASALLEGQTVTPGRAWHGSPAVDAGAAPDSVPAPRIGTRRRVLYAVVQLLTLLLVTGPLVIGVAVWADDIDVFDPLQAAWFAALLLVAGWLVRALVPRLLAATLRPGRDYPLYASHWSALRTATRIANSPMLNELFGDSSAIVWYLRSVGVRFRSVLQTGSNLGTAQHFDLPSWCSIGGGTLISDGLVMSNAEFSSHSFRVRPIRVGDHVFMGNGVVYPPGAGVGDDVLLATKVMVPVDEHLRSGVGLLGSPAFEVPRTVRRDAAFDSLADSTRRTAALRLKNRHNTATGVLFLLHRFLVGYMAVALVGIIDVSSTFELFLALLATVFAEFGLLVATDLLCRRFRRLRPLTASLYERAFWQHERYWKLSDPKPLAVLDGTPFKALAWRALGVRVGRMLLDDGVNMPERSMVRLGDHVTLGAGCTLHGHSLEDGVFKSGPITLEEDASVGPSALLHYGVVIGPRAQIAPDAFLMKGEIVRSDESWAGNPAHPAPAT